MRTRDLLRGWLPVALKEGRASLFSLRLIIVASILALAVLAGVYFILPSAGGSAGQQQISFGFQYYEEGNMSRPAMGAFIVGLTGDPKSGVTVDLVNETFVSGPQSELDVLESMETDSSGWARFEGLGEKYPYSYLSLRVEEQDFIMGIDTYPYNGTVEPYGQLDERFAALGGRSDIRILFLLFVDSQGMPLEGAGVYIWQTSDDYYGGSFPYDDEPPEGWEPYWNGTTDSNGFYLKPEPLTSGYYRVRAVKGELESTSSSGFYGSPNPLSYGPDGVLAFIGVLFTPIILPVMAMVLAYDSVARERSEGSLDMLLSKPVARLGVAFGKLAGVFASMATPVLVIFLAAAGLLWGLSGEPPTGPFLASFMGTLLLLLLIYTLLFLTVSANVRNLGTALLVSILLFLLFSFFWSLVTFIVAGALATPGSVAWLRISNYMTLASPTGIYQQLLAASLPSLFGGFVGIVGGVSTTELPMIWVGIAAAAWVVVLATLFSLAMKYRVSQ